MDDTTLELLSRSLDGDLGQNEAAELERRMNREPELRAELDDLREMRGRVAELARGMEPPPTLDALVKPLRRGLRPQRRSTGSATRWLAAAAVVVVGATVALEVARRHPGPEPKTAASTRRASPTPGFYQLQPLPTRDVPEEEELIGAADRLLASPLPDPDVGEPSPLEVIGPLPYDDSEEVVARRAAPSLEGERSQSVAADGSVAKQRGSRLGRTSLAPGRYPVVLLVVNGVIAAADGVTVDISELVGRRPEGLADGEFSGEIVVDEGGMATLQPERE